MTRLPESIAAHWLTRSSLEVAPDLVGCTLVRRLPSGEELRGTIVETEAYTAGDPACHAYRRRTARNAVMFGAAGYSYVYLIYGMYHCFNVVTDLDGVPSAVLIRALQLDSPSSLVTSPSSLVSSPLSLVSGPSSLVAGATSSIDIDSNAHKTEDKGQTTKDKAHKAEDKGQTTKDKGRRTNDKRQRTTHDRLAAGPGKLCRGMQIDTSLSGLQLVPENPLWLEPRSLTTQQAFAQGTYTLVQTTRIGISQGTDLPWRWYLRDCPAVSKR